MGRLPTRASVKAGLPPGTPVHVGVRHTEEIKITAVNYNKNNYDEKTAITIDECFHEIDKSRVAWINIDGLHDIPPIEKLGSFFGLHPLVVEDILNTEKMVKMDIFDEYVFIVLKMHFYTPGSFTINVDQLSIVLGKNSVLTFQEKEGYILEGVRNRLRNNNGRIRKFGADYLAYALMDAVVDHYFKVLEVVGEEIEDVEEVLLSNPSKETLNKIHFLKREMILLRKSIWPLREIISRLERDETSIIRESTHIYLRDLYEHTIQIIDTIETFRDMVSGMLDIYLSSISNRMNEIMKILTIFAAIFIPLTFITGIYGMNFNTEKSPFNMPELNWPLGYPFALVLMAVIGIGMFLYFKRNKWY